MTTKANKSHAMIETLESRRMMSVDGVTSMTVDSGALTITCSEGWDSVHVDAKSVYTAYRGVTGFYPMLEVTDFTNYPFKSSRFFAMDLNKVVLRGLGGDDHFTCTNANIRCEIYCGEGLDVVSGSSKGDLIAPGPDSDTVYGNAGDDVFIDEDGTRDVFKGGDGHDVLISTMPRWTQVYNDSVLEIEEYVQF